MMINMNYKNNHIFNKEETKNFYDSKISNYLCRCSECMNYYKNIKINYLKLADFLVNYGADIEKPVEVCTYHTEDNKQYCESYYVVIGNLKKNFNIELDNLNIEFINKEELFSVDITNDYFLIHINHLI